VTGHLAGGHLLPSVVDAVARMLQVVVSNAGWLLLVLLGGLVARAIAHRIITRLANTLAAPVRPGRLTGLVRAAARRPTGRAAPWSGGALALLVERRVQRANAIGSLLRSLASGALVLLAAAALAARAGVPGGAVFSAGALTLAVAVLFQGLAKDVLAGLFLLLEDTYGVTDYVDTTLGAAGVVEAIGLRTTRLRSRDGSIWHVRHSELVRIANRTQEQATILLDVTVGFPELAATPLEVGRPPGQAELARAERLIRRSLDRLDRDLHAARRAALTGPTVDVPDTLAALVPDLVPDGDSGLMRNLARASDAGADTDEMSGLAEMVNELLEDVDVPVLTQTLVVGLANANETSVTLRIRAQVADTDREQALAVLRRRLFLDVSADNLSVTFCAVDPANP
jgi:hypothetical protein